MGFCTISLHLLLLFFLFSSRCWVFFFFCTYERETSSSRRRETTNERAKRAQDKKLVNLLLSFLLACLLWRWFNCFYLKSCARACLCLCALCARSYKKINHFEAILLLFFAAARFFFCCVVLWCSRSRAVRLQFSHINSPRKWITLNIINYTILSSSLLSLSLALQTIFHIITCCTREWLNCNHCAAARGPFSVVFHTAQTIVEIECGKHK